MKITYFFRDQRVGNYSIEQIFKSIGKELAREHEVSYFYVDSKKSLLNNIIAARKVQGDINHITGDINWLALGLTKKKTILTVHDIGHYVNTLNGIKKWVYGVLWWRLPLKRVQHITAISNFTKDGLIRIFNVPKEKIVVIHNPISLEYKYSPKAFNNSIPKILQVGSMHNKNIQGLIEAAKDIACTLVLLCDIDEKLEKQLIDYKFQYEFHSDLSQEEVIDLYKSADLLFFASTYEGFGMPIIEAQAVGRPVLTSNICSMPEVAGDGAYFVDPYNVEEIEKSLREIIEDEMYRERLIKEGLKNVQRFHLNEISRQYLEVYKQVNR